MGGCASSKLNDMPCVVLCHDRCRFLSTAILHRETLSLSHSDYSLSLRRLSLSLSRSLYHSFFNTSSSSSPSQSDCCLPLSSQPDRCFHEEAEAGDDYTAFASSTRHEEPPPPPPPMITPSSGWDLLSFFDSYERVDVHRSLKLVQEEAGDGSFSEERTEGGEGGIRRLKRDGSDGGGGGLLYVVANFQSLMERVAGSCGDVSKMLVSTPQSDASPSSTCEGDETTSSVNISSIMENLWIWERKLYDEVKEEEKFKLIREKKCKQLKGMIEKGAETHVITEAKSVITALSINIKIAVDIVDNISLTIKKLQNEELLPHLVSFFNGLKEMWKRMAEGHKKLCAAISQAKGLVTAMTKTDPNRAESHSEAMTQLRLDLHHCGRSFAGWMEAQREYVRVMAHWLTAPLPYHEPKRAESAPASPRKPGSASPPPFAFCHAWSRAVGPEGLPVEAVLTALKDCASLLDPFCVGPAGDELRQPGRPKRKLKGTPKVRKLSHARDDRIDPLRHHSEEGGLHACLARVFGAMEAVAETSVHFYVGVGFT